MEIEQLRNRLSIGLGVICVLLIGILTVWGDSENEFHTHSFEMAWWLVAAILVFYMLGQAATTVIALIPKKRDKEI